ncbi:head-tail connector protein [Neorhizobium sp. Rsf11]|uniref:Head-tail connector protein n=1 Tax=Neorhizobium phenanthreniclasticum TaxID=3157917 RepID=A0ABV0LW57_9HYPH
MLVTLDLAKKHILVEHNDDDDLITTFIEAASGLCEEYLNRTYTEAVSGSDGQTDAPAAVVAAVLILVATLYRDREEQHVDVPPMVLPSTVRMLLAPYRDFCPDCLTASEGSGT